MKVLVTDYAWKDLEVEREILAKAGTQLIMAPTGAEDELQNLATDVDGILTNWKPVTQKVISNASRCRIICRLGVGLDNIDVRYATSVGIIVTNVPNYCREEVTEHALALLLSLARKVTFFDRASKRGKYDLAAGTPLFRIRGKTLGIVGFGSIGMLMAEKAHAFGLKVLVHSRGGNARASASPAVTHVSFAELLRLSDFISLHLPLTVETRNLFDYAAFQQMKPTAFLINTARGGIIEPAGLLRAFNDGLIAGAGLDVYAAEPPDPSDPLILHPLVIATPHAAFNSEESIHDLRTTAASQMRDLLSGRVPEFVVNPQVYDQQNLRADLKNTKLPASR
jgi:D-3-phosphoglycerate dehydrogenase